MSGMRRYDRIDKRYEKLGKISAHRKFNKKCILLKNAENAVCIEQKKKKIFNKDFWDMTSKTWQTFDFDVFV